QAEDGIRDKLVTGVQTCALPILDRARGAVAGDRGWIAATWDSLGTLPDGGTFPRPGRCTLAFERRHGRWLATHTHFSLVPSPVGLVPSPVGLTPAPGATPTR